MLGINLMCELSRRYTGPRVPGVNIRPLLEDACLQERYCLDAPDTVQDGVEWFNDLEYEVSGVVPRMIELRPEAPEHV